MSQSDIVMQASGLLAVTTTGQAVGFSGEASGGLFYLNVSAVTGTTPTLVMKLQHQEPVSGLWIDIPGAVTASINATGVFVLAVHPALTPVANSAIAYPVGRTVRAVFTLGGTTPNFTLSLAGHSLA